MIDISLASARAKDASDAMAHHKDAFALPSGVIYLDGNSLGALPKGVAERVSHSLSHEWGEGLIRSWNEAGWIDLPERCAAKLAPLLGAEAENVIVCDSTSVNLFKAISAALMANPKAKIITERRNFPTDNYIAEGVVRQLGQRHDILYCSSQEEIEQALDHAYNDIALVMLTEVNYRNGARHNMQQMTDKAHQAGALILWDLAHSAGAVPLALAACDVDFAVGCGYKFLNGGPGAPAFIYAAPRHQGQFQQPLSGWFAHEDPFGFHPSYAPDKGIKQYLCGTPPILSMVAFDEALSLWADVDLPALWDKSQQLCSYFIALIEAKCDGHDLQLLTTKQPDRRGSQVALRHPDGGYAMISALIDKGVIGDFRAPDILRFGITPLYTSFEDIWQAVDIFASILDEKSWDQPHYHQRKTVT